MAINVNILDRGESNTSSEPLIVAEDSPHRALLNDLALELAQKSEGLQASIPQSMHAPLASMVRSMNCYYSNLIEDHNTHPIDIERAMAQDFSANPEKRNLQLEAKTHVEVQTWVDGGGLEVHPTSPEALMLLHKKFCENLPAELLFVTDPTTGERVEIIPGVLRQRDVRVGAHIPVSPGALGRCLEHLHKGYSRPGKLSAIVGMACAHHRLAWLHPFVDFNGRVVRMVSHATALSALNSRGLWSISRGLARNVGDYKRLLAAADAPRQGDRDGRGNLSEARLASFAQFFLETSIDQVDFMQQLMKPEVLRERIMTWVAREVARKNIHAKSDIFMKELLYVGQIQRSEVAALLGLKDRRAREVYYDLLKSGAVVADGERGPLRLAFPAILAGDWMPGLFPDKVD